jgi:hypothetical protein
LEEPIRITVATPEESWKMVVPLNEVPLVPLQIFSGASQGCENKNREIKQKIKHNRIFFIAWIFYQR